MPPSVGDEAHLGSKVASSDVHRDMMGGRAALDRQTFERFRTDLTLAHEMVEKARRRDLDHVLLFQPGIDRGWPDRLFTRRGGFRVGCRPWRTRAILPPAT